MPLDRPLRVEGHTDDLPVAGQRYHDNWELSAARAATVVSYLERAHHAPPEHLQAVGLAATKPIAKADSVDARELNRRVEMVVELELLSAVSHNLRTPLTAVKAAAGILLSSWSRIARSSCASAWAPPSRGGRDRSAALSPATRPQTS